MNKHFKKCVLTAIMTSLLVTGCSIEFKSAKRTTNNFIPASSTDNNKNDRTLTPQQIDEDFEAFMTLIEDNYPFLEINKRVNGIDFLANKADYKARMKNVKTEEDLHNALDGIVKDLNNGHTHFLNHGDPVEYLEGYQAIVDYGYSAWVETLKQPMVAKHYGSMNINKASAQTSSSASSGGTSTEASGNLRAALLANNDLAYLKIKSFSRDYIEKDRKAISEFLTNAKNAKTLIIDIRGNGGGSTSYWEELLVQPLLNKPVTYKTYFLYKLGANNKLMLDSLYPDGNTSIHSSNSRNRELKPIESLKALHLENAKPEVFTEFDVYTESVFSLEPSKTGGFKGKIYLLVDSNVYSSSESFANFSKNTGFATLVGSKTGGDGIGRDPMLFALPNSGLVLRYSSTYGIDQTGAANEEVQTEPDFYVKSTYSNNNLSLDYCILEVTKLEGTKL